MHGNVHSRYMIIILIFHHLYYYIHVYVINTKIFTGIILRYFNMNKYWLVFCIRCWTLWDWLRTIIYPFSTPPPPRKVLFYVEIMTSCLDWKYVCSNHFHYTLHCYIYILAFIKIRDSFGSLWSDESWCWQTLIIR